MSEPGPRGVTDVVAELLADLRWIVEQQERTIENLRAEVVRLTPAVDLGPEQDPMRVLIATEHRHRGWHDRHVKLPLSALYMRDGKVFVMHEGHEYEGSLPFETVRYEFRRRAGPDETLP